MTTMFPLLLFPLSTFFPSFFLSYSDLFLPYHYKCRGLLLHLIKLNDTNTYTHTHTNTCGRIPLDEGSAYHRDLYLTTHNTYQGQTPMPPVGFEPAIPASELPHTYALDRAATGNGSSSAVGSNLILNELTSYIPIHSKSDINKSQNSSLRNFLQGLKFVECKTRLHYLLTP
jgi:hypothetical protein